MKSFDDLVAEVFAASAEHAIEMQPDWLLSRCESPIEKLFALAMWSRGVWTGRLHFEADLDLKSLLGRCWSLGGITGSPQVEIGKYRVDFLFVCGRTNNEPPSMIAVECDGHDFHDKTKEQAARDKARDRAINSLGIRVFRFTGSEIWADAGACAEQVLSTLVADFLESTDRNIKRSIDETGNVWAFIKSIREEQD